MLIYMPCSTCHFSVKVCWWQGTTGFLTFVCKSLDITFTYRECIASKGGSGEGVAFAIANLSLLSTASQDLVNVLSCKGLLFLFGFVFLANMRFFKPKLRRTWMYSHIMKSIIRSLSPVHQQIWSTFKAAKASSACLTLLFFTTCRRGPIKSADLVCGSS